MPPTAPPNTDPGQRRHNGACCDERTDAGDFLRLLPPCILRLYYVPERMKIGNKYPNRSARSEAGK